MLVIDVDIYDRNIYRARKIKGNLDSKQIKMEMCLFAALLLVDVTVCSDIYEQCSEVLIGSLGF